MDYSEKSLDELKTEDKKLKNSETISAFITGFLVAILIYGVVKHGFSFIHLLLTGFLLYGNQKHSQKQKIKRTQILEEIEARSNPS